MSDNVEAKSSAAGLACGTCGASVSELRRGRCWTCYTRWTEQRPVGLGAVCVVCDERRRDNLRLMEVQGRSLPLCHLCAARVGKLDVVPYSVEGLRAALRRDRRNVERRDAGEKGPGGVERRVVERRARALTLAPTPLGRDLGGVDEAAEIDLDLDLIQDMGALLVDDDDIVEATVVAEIPGEAAQVIAAEAPLLLESEASSSLEPEAPLLLEAEAPRAAAG